eukprot:1583299-Amphidinium_carterae.1
MKSRLFVPSHNCKLCVSTASDIIDAMSGCVASCSRLRAEVALGLPDLCPIDRQSLMSIFFLTLALPPSILRSTHALLSIRCGEMDPNDDCSPLGPVPGRAVLDMLIRLCTCG